MANQIIDRGTGEGLADGEGGFTAFGKVNDNFAELFERVAPAFVTADQDFASATLANVTELAVPVEANSFYILKMGLVHTAFATPDMDYSFPAIADAELGHTTFWETENAAPRGFDTPEAVSGSNEKRMCNTTGYLITGATAGTLQLQVAQRVETPAEPTTIHKGSFLWLIKG